MISASLITATSCFIGAQFFKALRLYFVLGAYRIKLVVLFILCSTGVVCSYLMGGGKPLIYELLVVFPLLFFFKIPFLASFYSLIVLRIFDALLLLLCIPFFRGQLSNQLVVFLISLAAVCWLLISTLPVVINRIEKRILISPVYKPFFTHAIRQLVSLKKELGNLAFGRKGTLPLTVLLTALIWLLEVLSLGIIIGDLISGGQDVINRIAGSLGMRASYIRVDYNELVLALSGFVFITLAAVSVRKLKRK
ncbi:MAG: hypothetical protein ACI4ND_01325 [Succinivibrio sp.]